jgi:hypothetical protein
MFQNHRLISSSVTFGVALLLWGIGFVSTALTQDFQQVPIILQAPDVLPSQFLKGSNYKVADAVRNDGFINTYDLQTSFGNLTIESTALVLIRINELKAIERMEQLKKTDVYTEALKKSATAPIKTAEGLVTDPVETTKGVVTGVGRFFGDVGRSIVSDDPHQAGVLKTATGQASSKREFAYEFGVDPYSTFQPLQKALDEITMTAGAGGLTAKVAFMAIPGAAGTAVGLSGTASDMKSLVRDKSPAELNSINEKKLRQLGVSDSLAKVFLKNPNYGPQEETLLVGDLAGIPGVRNAATFVTAASLANEESVALFMRVKSQLIALYSSKIKAIASFVEVNRAPLVKTKDGTIVGIFPLDYVAWTPALAAKERAISEDIKKMTGVKGKELWIMGTVDPVAKGALENRGWKIQDRVLDRLLK